jgi:hypothetical protein
MVSDRTPARSPPPWSWRSHVSRRSPRVDQCVSAPGADSNVSTTTASIVASAIVGCAPGRGASTSPSSRSATNRCRHFDTVAGLTRSTVAIGVGLPGGAGQHDPRPQRQRLTRRMPPHPTSQSLPFDIAQLDDRCRSSASGHSPPPMLTHIRGTRHPTENSRQRNISAGKQPDSTVESFFIGLLAIASRVGHAALQLEGTVRVGRSPLSSRSLGWFPSPGRSHGDRDTSGTLRFLRLDAKGLSDLPRVRFRPCVRTAS